MLTPSKKWQYTLRALYELAKHKDDGPTKISNIASAQMIPPRFLEVILNQLKGSGLVGSKRGFYGGYYLTRAPEEVSVGAVLRYLQKNMDTERCLFCVSQKVCPFRGHCAFAMLWQKISTASFKICDQTSLQDLLDMHDPAAITERASVG